jgi:hypothetical protein
LKITQLTSSSRDALLAKAQDLLKRLDSVDPAHFPVVWEEFDDIIRSDNGVREHLKAEAYALDVCRSIQNNMKNSDNLLLAVGNQLIQSIKRLMTEQNMSFAELPPTIMHLFQTEAQIMTMTMTMTITSIRNHLPTLIEVASLLEQKGAQSNVSNQMATNTLCHLLTCYISASLKSNQIPETDYPQGLSHLLDASSPLHPADDLRKAVLLARNLDAISNLKPMSQQRDELFSTRVTKLAVDFVADHARQLIADLNLTPNRIAPVVQQLLNQTINWDDPGVAASQLLAVKIPLKDMELMRTRQLLSVQTQMANMRQRSLHKLLTSNNYIRLLAAKFVQWRSETKLHRLETKLQESVLASVYRSNNTQAVRQMFRFWLQAVPLHNNDNTCNNNNNNTMSWSLHSDVKLLQSEVDFWEDPCCQLSPAVTLTESERRYLDFLLTTILEARANHSKHEMLMRWMIQKNQDEQCHQQQQKEGHQHYSQSQQRSHVLNNSHQFDQRYYSDQLHDPFEQQEQKKHQQQQLSQPFQQQFPQQPQQLALQMFLVPKSQNPLAPNAPNFQLYNEHFEYSHHYHYHQTRNQQQQQFHPSQYFNQNHTQSQVGYEHNLRNHHATSLQQCHPLQNYYPQPEYGDLQDPFDESLEQHPQSQFDGPSLVDDVKEQLQDQYNAGFYFAREND